MKLCRGTNVTKTVSVLFLYWSSTTCIISQSRNSLSKYLLPTNWSIKNSYVLLYSRFGRSRVFLNSATVGRAKQFFMKSVIENGASSIDFSECVGFWWHSFLSFSANILSSFASSTSFRRIRLNRSSKLRRSLSVMSAVISKNYVKEILFSVAIFV